MTVNIPKLFEAAFGEVIQIHAGPDLPSIKLWQSITAEDNEKVFPLIDIRATPPVTGDDGCTQHSNVGLLIMTSCNDDPAHVECSRWYEVVSGILDKLYSQFRRTASDEYNTFAAFIAANQTGWPYTITVGGFEHGEPLAPYEDGGANAIGLNFIVHFSRSDY